MLVLLLPLTAMGLPKSLAQDPEPSPNGAFRANVEWEDLGFVGILRMRLYTRDGKSAGSVDVPEIDPAPARLTWIDDEWVACESFLGEKACGFFYVHAPSRRGYLLEILEPKPGSWVVHTVVNDDLGSTSPVENVVRGRTSLFPILLRDIPGEEADFFTVEFMSGFVDAADAYSAFRRANGINHVELLGDADIRPELGAVVLARVDDRHEVIYFPAGAATPKEMFTRVRRQVLPDDAARRLCMAPGAEPSVRWLAGGEYVVESKRQTIDTPSSATAGTATVTTTTASLRSRFENVSDTPYVAPTPTPEPEPAKKTKSTGRKSKSTKRR